MVQCKEEPKFSQFNNFHLNNGCGDLKKGTYGQEVTGCKVIIELKKPSNIDSKSRFQTQGELISANHWSNYDALAILTDLNDFFWEFGSEIRSYKPASY